MKPLGDENDRQPFGPGQDDLLAADHGERDLIGADQRDAVCLEAVVELDVQPLFGKVALVDGDVERRELGIGNVAHRQANGCRLTRGRLGAATGGQHCGQHDRQNEQ